MFYEENISKLQNIFPCLQNAALSCLCYWTVEITAYCKFVLLLYIYELFILRCNVAFVCFFLHFYYIQKKQLYEKCKLYKAVDKVSSW